MIFSLIGQRAILISNQVPMGNALNFSSTLDKIGKELDCVINNGTAVEIVSDPFIIDTEKYGKLEVVKVIPIIELDDKKEIWVPILHLKLESKGSC
jgi:hypothetical protein